MVGAQDPLLIGQQLLGQPEGPAGITVLPGEQRDVAPAVRVSGWSARPGPAPDRAAAPGNSPRASRASPPCPVKHRDVVPGGEGAGMVGAQDPLLIGQQLPGQPEGLAGITALPGPARRCCPGW